MAYDAPNDWLDDRIFRAMAKGIDVRVVVDEPMREDLLRKRAARLLLSGVITPGLLSKLTD